MKLISADIQFYQQDRVAVYLESSLPEEEQAIGELHLFAAYLLRILYNLGNSPQARVLAELCVLVGREAPFTNLSVGLRLDDVGGIQLVNHAGTPGKYSFSGTFRYGDVWRFGLSYKGFGWLGRGLGYYAPTSSIALLRQLATSRHGDVAFQAALFLTAMYGGMLFLEGGLRVDNQMQSALALSGRALCEVDDVTKPESRPSWLEHLRSNR